MKRMTIIIIIIIISYAVIGLYSNFASAESQLNNTGVSFGNSSKMSKKSLQLSNQYIVTMKGNATESDIQHMTKFVGEKGGHVLQIYKHAIKGFSVTLPKVSASRTIAEIRGDPTVVNVEPDVEVNIARTK
jgi:peptidase inhibitor I9